MDKFECMKLFCRVAQLGSFTLVANEQNITQSAVSKKVAWLEDGIGITLLHRTSRKVSLTEQGAQYLHYANRVIEEMEQTESQLKGELTSVSGKLTLSAPSAFALQRLAKPISLFTQLHPNLQIDLSVQDQLVDLYQSNVDIAIRASYLKDSNLKARKLLDHNVCFFASPGYLKQHDQPHAPEELAHHACLTYSLTSPSNIWIINEEKYQVNEAFSSDSPEMIVEMARLDNGIAAMPRWMVEADLQKHKLIELFVETEKMSLPMYAVYKSSQYQPYRIRAFIDYLVDYFSQDTHK
ncbi:LysR family transcriptional regulator [Vibrio atypicus]|uniref:LysR family transcriptional regulator n=1 Tax=Vibrio atypicus TaxID=558271 RepID=UPI003734F55A